MYEKPSTHLRLIPNLTITKFEQNYPVYWITDHGPYEDVKPLIPLLLSVFGFDKEVYDLSRITLPLIFGDNLLWSRHLNVPSYGFILDNQEMENLKTKSELLRKKRVQNGYCVWEQTGYGHYAHDLEGHVPSYLISFIFDQDIGETNLVRVTSQDIKNRRVWQKQNERVIQSSLPQPTKVISFILLDVGNHYRILTGWFGCFSNQYTYQRLVHDDITDIAGNPYATEGYAKSGKTQKRWFT